MDSKLNIYGNYSFITDTGVRYRSVAHYYYTQKVYSDQQRCVLASLQNISEVENIANNRGERIRDNWSTLRKDILRKGLSIWITQHPEAINTLISTKDKPLCVDIRDNLSSTLANGQSYNRNDFLYTEDNLVGEVYMFIRKELIKLRESV